MQLEELKNYYIKYNGNTFYMSRDIDHSIINEINDFINNNHNKGIIQEWNNEILKKEKFFEISITEKISKIRFLRKILDENNIKKVIDELENEKENLSFFDSSIIIRDLIGIANPTNPCLHDGVIEFTYKTCGIDDSKKIIDILFYILNNMIKQINIEDIDKTILPSIPPQNNLYDICSILKYEISKKNSENVELIYKYFND